MPLKSIKHSAEWTLASKGAENEVKALAACMKAAFSLSKYFIST